MLKSGIQLMAILAIAVFSTASMCQKSSDNTGDQEPENTSLIGYWKVKSGNTYAINSQGQQIITATLKEGVFAHEFFADGTYKGHDLTGTNPSETGTWKLEVIKLDGLDIKEGILSITTPSSQSIAGQLFVDADGSMKYSIATINNPADGSKPIFTLETKKYEVYPYAENWAVYMFQKQ
ncbi:MAG TPA: hypothetical protein PKA00_18510 [Saprospiraceae bacterium]|nr:hypothetical protein [Saprospiraceae bacterium]HMQ84912.1 hypothetical protein [Saprospiraceae bacterium]